MASWNAGGLGREERLRVEMLLLIKVERSWVISYRGPQLLSFLKRGSVRGKNGGGKMQRMERGCVSWTLTPEKPEQITRGTQEPHGYIP